MTHAPKKTPTQRPIVRCAIYTRKSTEEGLEQDFNTLDAQRESAEAYIRSQAAEGWVCLPERYDDGGYSGGNLDRPAVGRLLAAIQAGQVEVVVVNKVDRLSRSLLDFAKIMAIFDRHSVSFVSVTQQFNTATSMGRLILHVLLSFAQFERELIAERTRDKIAATRRKGKWSGGAPLLGYDLDPRGAKLVMNEAEAARIRDIFALYVQHRGLLPVVEELQRRGWLTKRWVTRKGHERGGRPFTTTGLYALLTNVTYVGRIQYKQEVHAGEHPAIVDLPLGQQVQSLLQRSGRSARRSVRNATVALLRGLLRCGACGCAMTPSYASRNRTRRYRYYVCCGAQKRGWKSCPSKAIPAGAIEQLVLEQLQRLEDDASLLHQARGSAESRDPGEGREDGGDGHSDGRRPPRAGPPGCRAVAAGGTSPSARLAGPASGLRRIPWPGGDHLPSARPGAVGRGVARPDQGGDSMNATLALECDAQFCRQRGPGRPKVVQGATGAAELVAPVRMCRCARLLALALHFEELLIGGHVRDYAELALLGHVSRARITQIMNLLHLAPDLQEKLLFRVRTGRGRDPLHLARLLPIAALVDWTAQRRRWRELPAS
jgi:site-specific DNA recombinase